MSVLVTRDPEDGVPCLGSLVTVAQSVPGKDAHWAHSEDQKSGLEHGKQEDEEKPCDNSEQPVPSAPIVPSPRGTR